MSVHRNLSNFAAQNIKKVMEENKLQHNETQRATEQPHPIKPDILDYDDVRKMVPFFDGKPKLVKWLFHLLDMDDANWIHGHNCHTPGVPFCTGFFGGSGYLFLMSAIRAFSSSFRRSPQNSPP